MSGIGRFMQTESSGYQGWEWGRGNWKLTVYGYGVSLGDDDSVLELDVDGCIMLEKNKKTISNISI